MTSGSASAVELGTVGDTKFSVYGYAKLDFTYDLDGVRAGAGGLGKSVTFNNVAVGDQADTSRHFDAHAYQSRIGFKTVTPTEKGDLTTVIEGDFFVDGDLRLRHAYGSWNNITAGQTWSNFVSFLGTTETLDFTGQSGRGGVNRAAQIRYSMGDFHVALEDPDSAQSGMDYVERDFVNEPDRKDSMPDLTLRYESAAGPVKFAVAGMAREIAIDDGENDDSAFGWGLTSAASMEIVPGTVIRAHVAGGDGIGNYLHNTPTAAGYRVDNELDTITAWGGKVGITQDVGIGRINLAYSYVEADWDDAVNADAVTGDTDEARSFATVNYLWSPIDRVTYGIEASWLERETIEGDSGDATRLMASVIYDF
ncbi:DcaP family trimeric outer membrane transporter [Vreelandella titanicae]|uniref:DcaP family trimeric outer membrane transporter n=1 Tax=Vreelandella titanicae TaxID=664683 RepID=UPI001267D7BA|nr:DcaP family trimeric outer membrane transporter [Halomonas titanicae]